MGWSHSYKTRRAARLRSAELWLDQHRDNLCLVKGSRESPFANPKSLGKGETP